MSVARKITIVDGGRPVSADSLTVASTARGTGEDVLAHRGLKIIPRWERGNRAPANGTTCCT